LDGQKNFPVFIAIVDDEPDLAYLFRDALSQIPDARVFAFSDPLLALEHIRTNSENYQCVISDYRMPSITGIELLTKIQEINPRIKRILISAFDIQDEVFKNSECIDEFLPKPITMAAMIEHVKKHIKYVVKKIKEPMPESN
jgi:DNA-binding NtrC family response regulator